MSRDRSSHRHRRDRHDRDRDRDRDRGGSSHRSSRRRRDYSDDDDDRDDHRRRDRRRSRRRSRSRSRSRSDSRSGSRRHRRYRSRSESPSPMSRRNSRTILIMQLNPKVQSSDLEEFFSSAGKVREVRLIMDSKSRRHKGIAYIEFESSESAEKAYAMNGQQFFGAPIMIQSTQNSSNDWQSSSDNHQTSHSSHPSSHQSSRSHRHHIPPNSYRVYVGSLNVNLTEDMVRSIFEPFGPILRMELMRDRTTGLSRGYAFITYAHIEDGENAVKNLDGFELAGKALRVSKSTEKGERQPSSSVQSKDRNSGNADYSDFDSISRSDRPKDVTARLFELAEKL